MIIIKGKKDIVRKIGGRTMSVDQKGIDKRLARGYIVIVDVEGKEMMVQSRSARKITK